MDRSRLRLIAALRLAGATAALLAAPVFASAASEPGCELEAGPRRSVVSVIDGETLGLDDGSEVRLVGALAPRAADAARELSSWLPEAEATAALTQLVLGQTVELAFAGRRSDRYGRLLAHAFLVRDRQRAWVQGELLLRGHARAYALPQSSACLAELMQYEAVARATRRGVWSEAAYAERAAYRTRELMRYRGTYQLVAGRVARVAEVNGRTYLNFGADWRDDFTVGIAPTVLRAAAGWAGSLQGWAGRNVRVRGWIERRNGPYIELSVPEQIELLEGTEGGLAGSEWSAGAWEVKPNAKRPAHTAPGAPQP
jgi:endonuclease YncB( thermonuclease family)